jgi:GTP cyclohydrolase I
MISDEIKQRLTERNVRFHSNDNISEHIAPYEIALLQEEVEQKFKAVLDSLVIDTSGPISIRSTCAHHFQNIVGKCWVGIVPEDEVIGLSKFNRLVHHIAERPQIQEEMTTQIAKALSEYAKTPNVAVVVKAEHHCMTHRGVREHENDMTTAIMLGAFQSDPYLKQEFYDICLSMKGHK